MKIALCQIKSKKGDIALNSTKHIHCIEKALDMGAQMICFPELSLTGYKPTLAKVLSLDREDKRLKTFKEISYKNNCTIIIGAPTPSLNLPRISMLIFKPDNTIDQYNKQLLHQDETPYFSRGKSQKILTYKSTKIALAICYESLHPEHLKNVICDSANLYLAFVAKSKSGVSKAYQYYATSAKQYNIPILMVNALGVCDNFVASGGSAIWNKNGQLIEHLSAESESILLYDTESEYTKIIKI